MTDMNMTGSASISEHTEVEQREGAIRTALFLLASSLILSILSYLHYVWQ